MTAPRYDHAFWETLWAKTLREHGDKVARKPPSAYVTTIAEPLRPGRAVDAGCGHGAEALWLAAHGWQVTGVDFSSAALGHARAMGEAAGAEIAARLTWVQADLAAWAPEPATYELVLAQYVHVAGSVDAWVRRLARGVARGGTLLLVGHQPVDPATGAATAAAGQTQVSVADAVAALDDGAWTLAVAEERPRTTGGGVDAVVCACRG